MRSKGIVQIANYGLANSIVHTQNLIGDLYEFKTEESQSIS